MTSTSKQWVIMGHYKNYNCVDLVCALPASYTNEQAIMVLDRMTYHPTDADRLMIRDEENLWLEEVDAEDAWWNDNCD